MDENRVKILELKETLLADNDADAEALRSELREAGTFYLNVMSSPGAGKTSSILQILRRMKGEFRVGVLEADIDGDVDARTVLAAGVPAVQLHTGGMCHLDADMSRQSLRALGAEKLDLVILENVGNLVCPAEFDTGAHKNLVILSVPEGNDKPLKYPLMFRVCQAVLVNKTDTRRFFRFDDEAFLERVWKLNPEARVFFLSAKTGEGFDPWLDFLREKLRAH